MWNRFAYRREHIEGSFFLTRADLETDLKLLPDTGRIILVSDDIPYAQLVGRDLTRLGRKVQLLAGGIHEWSEVGYPTSTGLQNLVSRPVDTYFEAEHYDGPLICARENHAYLNWEIALIDHIVGDPAVRYVLKT